MVSSSLRWTPWLVLVLATACVVVPPPPPGTVIDHPPDPNAAARAGGPLPGLTAAQLALFKESTEAFSELDTVTGSGDTSRGLGPRFNLDACSGCHAFPAAGGSSGLVNPQPVMAKADGATNDIDLPFLHANGPIMEVRFKSLMDADGNFLMQSGKRRPDGGVHQLFTITGRSDAGGCAIRQPPFQQAWVRNNLSLRIPTPLFGLGLIEAISESTIRANSLETMLDVANAKRVVNGRALDFNADYYEVGVARDRLQMYRELGIVGRPGRGRENRSGNDSTITRFGWKAQNKSLLLFAGEAYNVEQGVTNELFTNERDTEPLPLPDACKSNATPEDDTKFDQLNEPPSPGSADSRVEDFAATAGDLVKFELFMRMLAPPKPACDMAVAGSCSPNIVHGSQVFDEIHCSACHVRGLKVGPSSIAAISQQQVANLFSDLLLHKMGACPPYADHTPKCLADDISQGQASGDEFRTAPLWGVGQRVFFLHDGRARDLPSAILAHKGPGSEANVVVHYYEQLPASSKQELTDFLRSL